jgi:hypothetical protein
MEKVKEYKVVQKVVRGDGESPTKFKFEELINTAIKEGWQPLGGVQTTLKSASAQDQAPIMVFVQSLVR